MMTTFVLGGTLKPNLNQTILRKEFVTSVQNITKQEQYSDSKIFGSKITFGSQVFEKEIMRDQINGTA